MFDPQNSVQSVIGIVQIYILELFYDKDLVQTVVDETSRCAGQLKNCGGNIFSSSPAEMIGSP
jgi:hypothetical protein